MEDPMDDGACCETEAAPEGSRKAGVALLLACPACAGGLFFAVGTAFGVGAFALKGALLAAIVGLVGGLWIRNAWRRRGEGHAHSGRDGSASKEQA